MGQAREPCIQLVIKPRFYSPSGFSSLCAQEALLEIAKIDTFSLLERFLIGPTT